MICVPKNHFRRGPKAENVAAQEAVSTTRVPGVVGPTQKPEGEVKA